MVTRKEISKELSQERKGDLSQEKHPFKKVYACKYGCGFVGTPQELSAHYRTVHREEFLSERGKFRGGRAPSMEIEAPQIPDAMSQLHNFLRVFGLSERDSQAVLKYMENYNLDNLIKLHEALRDVGLAHSRRKLLIESWANVRNIVVPPPLQRELGIQPMLRTASYESSYGPSTYGFEPSYGSKESDLIDKLIKWEQLKLHAQTPSPNNPLESQYQQQIESLRQEIQTLRENHSKEVESLKEELRKKEKERLESQIQSLQEQIRRIESQSRPSGDYHDDAMRLLAESIREIGKKMPMEKLLNFISKHPELFSMAYGERPQRQVPPQARRPLIEVLKQKGLVVQE